MKLYQFRITGLSKSEHECVTVHAHAHNDLSAQWVADKLPKLIGMSNKHKVHSIEPVGFSQGKVGTIESISSNCTPVEVPSSLN